MFIVHGDEAAFKLISEAYSIMYVSMKRYRYDIKMSRNVFWTKCPSCKTQYQCPSCKTQYQFQNWSINYPAGLSTELSAQTTITGGNDYPVGSIALAQIYTGPADGLVQLSGCTQRKCMILQQGKIKIRE
jgi:hypothetical protein